MLFILKFFKKVWIKNLLTLYKKPSKLTEYEIFKNHLGFEYIVTKDGLYYDVQQVIKQYGNCYITVNKDNVRVLKFYEHGSEDV